MIEYKPKKIRKNTDDEESIREVFEKQAYNPKWFESKVDFIKNIIDVGGLVGSYSLWAYENYPNAKIYVYEPNPDSYEFLVDNVKALRCEDRIEPYKIAVWNKKGSVELHSSIKKSTSASSIIFKPKKHLENELSSVKVNTISIEDVLNQIGEAVDILKLDCEGAEFDIIYSLRSEKFKSIKHIVMEYHNYDSDPTRIKELVKFLRKNGFLVQKLTENEFLGYIYAKQVGAYPNEVNNLIDELDEIRENRYIKLQNRKIVKLGLKFGGFLSMVKNIF